MRGNAHGGCGRRLGETHRWKHRQGAPGRPHLVPTRDRSVAAPPKNYRYSTNLQVIIDANTRLVIAVGHPLPGSRHDARAYGESAVDQAVKNSPLLGNGGYRGTRALIPHWPRKNRPLTTT